MRVKLGGGAAEDYGEMPIAAARPKIWKLVTAPLLVTASAVALAGPAEASTAGRVTQYNALEPRLVAQINGVRASRGLARVRVTTRLTTAATRHANSMGASGYFSHDLLTPAGLKPFSTWMGSPPHRANLLNRRWRNVGVAAVRIGAWPGAFQGCAGDVTLVAAEFGRRS